MKQEDAEAAALAILDDTETHAAKKYGIEIGQAIDDQLYNEPKHRAGATVLKAAFRGRVIFEAETGKHYERTPGGWYEEITDMLSRASAIIDAAAVRAFRRIMDGLTGSALQAAYLKAGAARRRAQSREFIQSALAFFAEETLIPKLAQKWNTTPEALPTVTGVLDYSGNEIITRPPREDEYFRDPLPVSAEDVHKEDMPAAFLLTLCDYFPDPEVRKTATESISLAVSNRGSRTFQLWHGEAGANGKNTLIDILRAVLPGRVGTIAGTVITRGQDGGAKRFGAAELEGKLLAAVDEVAGSFDVPEVKRLTGASTLTIERKGLSPYEITQRWALVALTNRLPSFSPATDSAFLQRLIILPFDTIFFFNDIQREEYLKLGIEESRLKPAHSKEELVKAIERERPAILRYLIQQYQILRKAGGRPYECGKSLQLKQSYASANDLVAQFFLEHFQRDPAGRVEYARILELWKEYTGDKTASVREVSKKLMERFSRLTKQRSNGKNFIQGLREGGQDDKEILRNNAEYDNKKHDFPIKQESEKCSSAENGLFILRDGKAKFPSSYIKDTLFGTSALENEKSEDPQLLTFFDAASKLYDLAREKTENQTGNLKAAGLDGSSTRVLIADLKREAETQGINAETFRGALQTLKDGGLIDLEDLYLKIAGTYTPLNTAHTKHTVHTNTIEGDGTVNTVASVSSYPGHPKEEELEIF